MMRMRPTPAALMAVFLAAAMTGRASAGLVTNGDFESGSSPGWSVFATPNGTIASLGPASFDTTGTGTSLAIQFRVGQRSYVFGAHEGGGIYQTITTTGGDLSLSTDVASFNIASSGVNGDGGRFELLLDGTVLDSHQFRDISAQQTLRATLSATVSGLAAGVHELRLRITRSSMLSGVYSYLDNIQAVEVQPVPEPSSLTLGCTAALVGLACAWRRRTSG